MKIRIDASNFSFRFIAIWLVIVSIVIYLFICKIVGILGFLFALFLYSQKYKYLIPNKQTKVSEKIEKTLKSLGLNYQKTTTNFSTKIVKIKIFNCMLFTVLHFKFDKVYNVQGKYLSEVVVKYQRYT